jgi:hypothetical protein
VHFMQLHSESIMKKYIIATILLISCTTDNKISVKCNELNILYGYYNGYAMILPNYDSDISTINAEIRVNKTNYAISSYYKNRPNLEISRKINSVRNDEMGFRSFPISVDMKGIFLYDEKDRKCYFEIEKLGNVEVVRDIHKARNIYRIFYKENPNF